MVDTTELLENTIGYFGRWQVMIVILLFLSRFSVAYHPLLMVVQHYAPKAKTMGCIDGTDSFKIDVTQSCYEDWLRQNPDKAPQDFLLKSQAEIEHLFEVYMLFRLPTCPEGCTKWRYAKYPLMPYKETVVTQYHLVCNYKWILSLIQSMVMAGILLGNVTLGRVADKYGRKKVLIAEIIVQVVAGTIAAFLKGSLAAFIIFRVVAAFATGGIMLTGFIHLMEFVAKKHRTVIGILFHLPFQLGHASLGSIAYQFLTWSDIQLCCSGVNIWLLCYICLLPESIQWLVTKDRGEDVVKILEKAAKCNRLPTEEINSKVVSLMKQQAAAPTESVRCGDLCSTKRMKTKMIVLSINWFVVEIVFYGVAELMAKLDANPHPFRDVMVSGVAQVPGTLICLLICRVFGNKISLIVSYVVTSIPMIVMMVLPSCPNWPVLLCESVSIMGCSMSYAIIYLYTAELIPNVIRNLGMGVTLGIGSFGGMLAPIIVCAKSTSIYIPLVTFLILPVIAALLTFFFLPNTKNIEIPDTVEEADNL